MKHTGAVKGDPTEEFDLDIYYSVLFTITHLSFGVLSL